MARPSSPTNNSRALTLAPAKPNWFVRNVQKPVDDHARKRNVEPQRKRPSRDRAMAKKILSQRERQRREDQRQDHDCQNRVRNQQREIHGANPALPAEANQPCVKMKIQIEAEKNRGTNKSAKHACSMRGNFLATNKNITGQ